MIEYKNEHNLFETRFGHSAVTLENSIYIYGGEEKYHSLNKKRNLFNDVYKFDTLKMSWKGVKWSDMALSKRKHHASWVVGDTIIFHGGLGKYLHYKLFFIIIIFTKKIEN